MQKRPRMQKRKSDVLDRWTLEEADDLYGVTRWSDGLFAINGAGNVVLHTSTGTPDIDLKSLVDEIRMRGLELPVLIRFTDILRQRIERLAGAFAKAIADHEYEGQYRGVYPIKVNQHRHVLEDVVDLGRPFHFGLEAGSKPELLLAIAHQTDPEALIVCNGFKDEEYLRLALEARRLGRRIFIVVEKLPELEPVLRLAREMKVTPLLGARMKLASRGRGLWESSGGDRSKFGLYAGELLEMIRILRRRKRLDSLQLLHFHLGSQITDIQRIKNALREAATLFVEMRRLGAPIDYADVGGGLAVDYDGSRTKFASSANYDLAEYAADVIESFHTACAEADQPHPTIITEAGRAMVAHHSVLVAEAFATNEIYSGGPPPRVPKRAPEVLQRMAESYETLSVKNFQETYHDILEARREALMLFTLRHLSLEERATAEAYFWKTCRRILGYMRQLDYVPDELEGLEQLLATVYFCNFSIFQSVPDHWAIKQLFPVMPLHRLDERPSVQGILADITCDSDGSMDRFVDLRDVRDTLPLHPLRKNEPYYLGLFLLGAYQEILGDLHNLFGDTTVVHVSSDNNGYAIDKSLPSDTLMDVLGYVQYRRADLVARMRVQVEAALKEKRITLEQSAALMREFESGLDRGTYLASRLPAGTKKSR